MSEQANVQVIRHAYAAFARGDIQPILDSVADDVEWETPGPTEVPYAGLFRGKDGVADFFRILNDAEEVMFFEAEAFFGEGDRVVALGHYSSRIKETNRDAQTNWAHSFVMRGGKVVKFREYYDTAAYAQAYKASAPTLA
jgi:ketosteroid isomerase-like protein